MKLINKRVFFIHLYLFIIALGYLNFIQAHILK